MFWLIAAAGLAVAASAAPLRVLKGHVPAGAARSRVVGLADRAMRLNLAIGLPLRNQDALGKLLNELYDPSSTNYHRYLTPQEFAARFGPTASDYQAVIAFAQSNGLRVTREHGN